MNNLYALIMAGGGGTRLWPESRNALPKQFIKLLDDKSLLQIALDRVTPVVPAHRVLVVTGRKYRDLVLQQLPDLPAENVIVEPSGRNTAPAIGLGAIHLQHRDPNAIMAALTADHIMHREDDFRRALLQAARAAMDGRIITLGIQPSAPETGYGYIERGNESDDLGLFPVRRFREKPDLATARNFVESGRFYWNSGMFIWRVDTVMAEIARQLPDLHGALTEMAAALGSDDQESTIKGVWGMIEPVCVDYGIMEHAQHVAVLPVDPGWMDVGSWGAVYEEGLDRNQNSDLNGNVVQSGGQLVSIDTHGCLVRSRKLVAMIGLQDLVVVETPDAILICPREKSQGVKKLVDLLKDRTEFL